MKPVAPICTVGTAIVLASLIPHAVTSTASRLPTINPVSNFFTIIVSLLELRERPRRSFWQYPRSMPSFRFGYAPYSPRALFTLFHSLPLHSGASFRLTSDSSTSDRGKERDTSDVIRRALPLPHPSNSRCHRGSVSSNHSQITSAASC